ncbi:MAG: hypothetical protein ACRDB6_04845, partial [Cetobacterium sp.]
EGTIYSMNTDGTGLSEVKITKGPESDFNGEQVVGVFFDNAQNFYIYNTITGRTYVVNVGGDKILKPYIGSLGPAGGGDGARNITAPVSPRPDVSISKQFLEGQEVYDDVNKVLKLRYLVTIQNNNNLLHLNSTLTDILNFDPSIETAGIRFEAIKLPDNSILNSETGTVSNILIPGNQESTGGKLEIEFYVNIPYSAIKSIQNTVKNTVKLTYANKTVEATAEGDFTVKEVLFLNKERIAIVDEDLEEGEKVVDGVKYSADGNQATAKYRFTLQNPMGLTHAKLSVKDLFVDKNTWEPKILDVLIGTESLLPVDSDGNIVISTAGIGPNATLEIEITIVYDLTAMTTTAVTLKDFGQVTSYLSDSTNGTLSDPTAEVSTPLLRVPKVSIEKKFGSYLTYGSGDRVGATYIFTIKNETAIEMNNLTMVDKLLNIKDLNAYILSVKTLGATLNTEKDEIKITGINLKANETVTKVLEIVYGLEKLNEAEIVENKASLYSSSDTSNPLVESNIVETNLKLEKPMILKRVDEPVYNIDGTASVTYTFTVKNLTEKTYENLAIVDYVRRNTDVSVKEIIGGSNYAYNRILLDERLTLLPGEIKDVKLTFVYNVENMKVTETTIKDFGLLYDLSDGSRPDTGSESDGDDVSFSIASTPDVEVVLKNNPRLKIKKSGSAPKYNDDGTADVTYNFEIENPTAITYPELTIVDKILSLGTLVIKDVQNGTYDEDNKVIVLTEKLLDFTGGSKKTLSITIKYDLDGMNSSWESASDEAYLYDTSNGKEPGFGLENEENPALKKSNVVTVNFNKYPEYEITKSVAGITYNRELDEADVIYHFKVKNISKIYGYIKITDRITDLHELEIVKLSEGWKLTDNKIERTNDEDYPINAGEELIKELTITYSLKGMTIQENTVKNIASVFDEYSLPKDSEEVEVKVEKPIDISIQKEKSTLTVNDDGSVDVQYEFTIKNSSKFRVDNLELKDKIYDLGKVKINSVVEVIESKQLLDSNIEFEIIEGYMVYKLGVVSLEPESEITKVYKINYNLEDMETISQTVKDIGTINIVGDENSLAESEIVDTVLEKSPAVSITKTPSTVKYNEDGTAEVDYTFEVKNETKIPYKGLTVVDEIVSLGKVTIASVEGGELVGSKVTLAIVDLAGEQVLPLTLKVIYNLDNMVTKIDTVTDKAVVYDGDKPVTETPVVEVPIEKTPELTIVKTASSPTYNADGTASVKYTFTVNNPTKIPTSVTVVDKVLELGDLTIVGATYNGTPLTITNNIIQLPEVKDLVGSTDLVVEFTYDLAGMTTEIDSVTDRAYLYTNLENPLPPGTDPEDPGQVNTPSEDVTVNVTKSPLATVVKTAGSVTYNDDETADVVYTFVITNETKIPYPSLTLVDKIISLDNLKVLSVSEGTYSEANGTITLAPLTNFVNSVSKNVIVKYDLKGMTAQLESAKDKAYLYDTSEGKEPGIGSETDKNIVANS